MIRLKGASRTYVDGERAIQALTDVTLDIPRGQTVALVGMSGSGKSTLLHLIGGMEWPSAGNVTVDGVQIDQASEPTLTKFRLHTVGFVFQFFHLLPELNALENVMLPGELAGWRRQVARRRALERLGQVGLAERAKSFPNRLSGGEQQRVAIARALMLAPPVLLADEPTGNLDSTTGEQVIELVWRLAGTLGITVVLATHSETLASRADRRIGLHDGRIVSDALQRKTPTA